MLQPITATEAAESGFEAERVALYLEENAAAIESANA